MAGSGGLAGAHGTTGLIEFVYVSATTFTTLGYGDFVPVGHLRFLFGTEALHRAGAHHLVGVADLPGDAAPLGAASAARRAAAASGRVRAPRVGGASHPTAAALFVASAAMASRDLHRSSAAAIRAAAVRPR